MILRLRLYRLVLKIGTYTLPVLAFYLGWWIWKAACAYLGRPVLYFPHANMNQLLFALFVWAL